MFSACLSIPQFKIPISFPVVFPSVSLSLSMPMSVSVRSDDPTIVSTHLRIRSHIYILGHATDKYGIILPIRYRPLEYGIGCKKVVDWIQRKGNIA